MEQEPADPPKPPENQIRDLKLTPEEGNHYTDLINRKAATENDACPVCESPHSYVDEHLYRVETVKDPPALGGRAMPLFATVCHNCSYVRFFNRLVADSIITRESTEAPELPLNDIGAGDGE